MRREALELQRAVVLESKQIMVSFKFEKPCNSKVLSLTKIGNSLIPITNLTSQRLIRFVSIFSVYFTLFLAICQW